MTPRERFQRAAELFLEASSLPAAGVDAFLKSSCGDDPQLQQQVRDLLGSRTDESVFQTLAGQLHSVHGRLREQVGGDETLVGHASFAPGMPDEKPGDEIGGFRLLELIGEGGFGRVWAAEQRQPVERRVALKVIKAGMDTRQVVARFEQERQALAMMDHPNIAKVFEAGATASGRPYFVMELCKGEPISTFCDLHQLTIAQRLELFLQVCGAVQHAHTKGVIHRDIKPSNVLVSTQDGKPYVRVIDFGIAKATSSRLTEKTVYTEHRQFIGTPEYMSPEQADGSLDIDTRTDVYSLGVLLYELLTGTTPFSGRELRSAAYGELQRIIREVDPPRPSTRLSESRDTLASVAATRRTEPRRLGTLIRGELDWIVMKALEKDRGRRFATAAGLAEDVRRHLDGVAVTAAPPSRLYQTRKFVRRHRGLVAAAGAVTLALMLGVAGFAWQASVASRQRDEAITARQGESLERQRAGAINQFLLDMLDSASLMSMGRDVRVVDALDSAAAKVGTAFTATPSVEAAVRRILGQTYLSLSQLDKAEPQLIAALELSRKHDGEVSAEYIRVLGNSAMLSQLRGRMDEATERYRRVLDLSRKLAGDDRAALVQPLMQLGNVLSGSGQHAEAEKLLTEARELCGTVSGVSAEDKVRVANSLAVTLHRQGKLDPADALYRESAELSRKLFGAEHPDTLTAEINVGAMQMQRGKLDEAEATMLRTYEQFRRVCGETHDKTGTAAYLLGMLYMQQGRFKDAVPYYEACVAIRRANEGDGSAGVAGAKVELSRPLRELGEFDRAITLLQEAVAAFSTTLGPEHSRTLNARVDLANVYRAGRRIAEAERLFRELLESVPRVKGPDDPLAIIVSNSYGLMLMQADRAAEGEPYIRAALEKGRRVEGPDARNTIITQHNLAAAMRESGRYADAEAMSADTIERMSRTAGPRHGAVATMRSARAEALMKLNRYDEAERELRKAIEIAKGAYGEQNHAVANLVGVLAGVLSETGRAAEAEPLLRDALPVLVAANGPTDLTTTRARVELGRSLLGLGKFAEAETELRGVELLFAGDSSVKVSRRRALLTAMVELYTAWHAAVPGAGHDARIKDLQLQLEKLPVPVAAPAAESERR